MMKIVNGGGGFFPIRLHGKRHWSRLAEAERRMERKQQEKIFLSKGATLIVTTMLFASFLITIKQYNHKNKQYHHNEPNHNETIQS